MINVETTKTYDVIEFYVVDKKHCGSLLGCQSATKLSLLKVVRQVQVGNVGDEFPELFRGTGKLNNRRAKLHINSAVPPVAQRHRRTSFHLRDKVKNEIDKLLAEDIIEKVEGVPTPWVSPIVTPPKEKP
ncbi:uncharacterized protein LOC110445714 [Mizuhopecten yessoensis]|uniref:uncharacterized protein LOC110445714 n=1 Tax=Mizuhopecten yessoensis TaxID=6573 RepID=UPI000B45795D|nr:uncharacterized protein LOC110445714 [Mizuhopecten yessoensis]